MWLLIKTGKENLEEGLFLGVSKIAKMAFYLQKNRMIICGGGKLMKKREKGRDFSIQLFIKELSFKYLIYSFL